MVGGGFWVGLGFAAVLDPEGDEEGEPDEEDDGGFDAEDFHFPLVGEGGDVAVGAFGLEDVLGEDAVFLF